MVELGQLFSTLLRLKNKVVFEREKFLLSGKIAIIDFTVSKPPAARQNCLVKLPFLSDFTLEKVSS